MKKDNLQVLNNFVIFETENGKVNIDVYFQDDTLWLTQKLMSVLFEKGRSTITEHLKNIFASGELDENSVCRNFRHTAEDGKNYTTKYYNLRAITAVGYRVNSTRATQFRKWATFLDKFLALSDYPILTDKGKVSSLEAKLKAESEYDKFRVQQDRDYISDFDKHIKQLQIKVKK